MHLCFYFIIIYTYVLCGAKYVYLWWMKLYGVWLSNGKVIVSIHGFSGVSSSVEATPNCTNTSYCKFPFSIVRNKTIRIAIIIIVVCKHKPLLCYIVIAIWVTCNTNHLFYLLVIRDVYVKESIVIRYWMRINYNVFYFCNRWIFFCTKFRILHKTVNNVNRDRQIYICIEKTDRETLSKNLKI